MSLPRFVEFPDPSIYLGENYLVLDFETTNEEYGSALVAANRLVLACWRVGSAHRNAGDGRSYSVWGDELQHARLLQHISSADFIVAHNTKFELQWLARCGADLRKLLPYDTMLGEYVIAGNRKWPLNLESVGRRYGLGGKESFVSRLIKAGVPTDTIPRLYLEQYCRRDVELTERVFTRQRQELAALGLLPTAYSRNLATPVLADIERHGMTPDKQRVIDTYDDYSQRWTALNEEFAKVTGGINPKSTKQMREYLFDKLKFAPPTDYRGKPKLTTAGQLKADKATIAELVAKTPEQKAFKKLAHAVALMKVPVQNLTKLRKYAESGEKVFASFNQAVTQTHRLSSSARGGGFQFQNFDRAFKPLFRSSDDSRVIVDADASQLEFRVAAHLGRDKAAKRSIQSADDVHAFTASILGVSRQEAKPHTFKPLYGGQSGTKREKEYYAAFREKYPQIYETQRGWTVAVAGDRDNCLVTETGLRFYWPGTKIRETGYVENTPSIYNYPVQSLATADIIPLILVMVWHLSADMDVHIINTQHDSIIADVDEKYVDEYRACLVESFTRRIYPMLERLYGIKFWVPLGCEVKASRFWGEGKGSKYEATGQ